jgi:hypothetical protein
MTRQDAKKAILQYYDERRGRALYPSDVACGWVGLQRWRRR